MRATWYVLRRFVNGAAPKDGAPMKVLVVSGRIAANSWHVSLTGEPWAEFRKEKEGQGWKIQPLYCGPRVI